MIFLDFDNNISKTLKFFNVILTIKQKKNINILNKVLKKFIIK